MTCSPRHPCGRVRLLIVLTAGLLLPACRDGTGPGGAIEIRFTASAGPEWVANLDGPTIECGVEVTATASGSGDAEWTDAQLFLAQGPDRTVFEHARSWAAGQAAGAWGAPRIAAGQTRRSTWTIQAGLPYTARLDFGYRLNSTARIIRGSAEFDCGPRPVPGASGPTIRDIVISPNGAVEIGGGSMITVSYTVESPAGLWATMIGVEGAFSVLDVATAAFEPAASRTVRLAVPASATPGHQVWIGVSAMDLAGRSADSELVAGPIVVDRTPPQIASASLHSSGYRGDGLAGRFTEGDTLWIDVAAYDNHRLAHLIYEIGPPANVRDSVTFAPEAGGFAEVELPLPDRWVGAAWLSLQVRDAVGLSSDVLVTAPGLFHIQPQRERPVQTTTLAGSVRDVAHDHARDVVYLAMHGDRRIHRVGLAPLRHDVVATLPRPVASLDVSPDGTMLLAAVEDEGELVLVDPTGATAPRAVALTAGGGGSVAMVRFASAGRAMVVVGDADRVRIVEIDPRDGAQAVRWEDQHPLESDAAASRAGDGSRIGFLLNRHCVAVVYDVATDTFSTCHWLAGAGPLVVSGDGSRFGRDGHVFDGDLVSVWSFPVSDQPTGLSADGAELLIAGGKGLTRTPIDMPDPGERIRLPGFRSAAILATADGRRLAVIGAHEDEETMATRVAVIDLH